MNPIRFGPVPDGGASLPQLGPRVVGYNVRYCPVDMEGAWTYHSQPATGVIQIPGGEPGVRYIVEVQCVPNVGFPSDWVRLEHTVVGVASPPAAPTAINVVSGTDHNKVSVTLPSKIAADVEVEFHWAPDVNGAPGVWAFLELAKGTETKDTYTSGEKRWYRARTVDYQDNVSDWISTAQNFGAKTSEDGATVGAPPGTPVGDRQAEDVDGDAGNIATGDPARTEQISTSSGATNVPWGGGVAKKLRHVYTPRRIER